MVLGTIEIIALIAIILAAIKILVLLVNPKTWMSVVKFVYGNPSVTMVVSLILSVLVLWYLLGAGITIIEIFAVMTLIACLGAMGVAAYSKDIVALAGKMLKDKNVVKKAWLAIIVWIALILWALKILFF